MSNQGDPVSDGIEAGSKLSSGDPGGVTESESSRHQSSFLMRFTILGAAGAIVVAIMGLLGYIPGLGSLGSVREDYIPMAPSTAIGFVLLGGILLAMTFRRQRGTSLVLLGILAALVSLFGALEVAGHYTGLDLNFEDVLVPSAGHLGEIPIARMSPATGAAFFVAGLAVLVLVLRQHRNQSRATYLGHSAGSLGCVVLVISLVFCLAYLYGSPLLYGKGATVPMALTTALAFLSLGVAAVGAAGRDAVPVVLVVGIVQVNESMSARRRFVILAFIMIVNCAVVMVIMMSVLYRHELDQQQQMLQSTARSQARLIEAVARYDVDRAEMIRDHDPDYDPVVATLSQIIDAHEHYENIGETVEFTLARIDGDQILFVLRHRHSAVEHPEPVPIDSNLAEPMRRALQGMSGTVIASDYRGETVLAAHEPVTVMNLGIVAKIDLAEVRAPFIRSGFMAAVVGFLAVLVGAALFFRIGNPIIAKLEAHSQELEEEVEHRRQTERAVRESERRLATLMSNLPGMAYRCMAEPPWTMLFASEGAQTVTGYEAAHLTGDTGIAFEDLILTDDGHRIEEIILEALGAGLPFEVEYDIRAADGEVRHVWERGRGVEGEDGTTTVLEGFIADITDRKHVEEERETTLYLLKALGESDSQQELIQRILNLMRSWSGCSAVGIRLAEGEDFPYCETQGFSEEFVKAERSLCAGDREGGLLRDSEGNAVLECMCGNVICGRFNPDLPFFTEHGSFWSNCTTELLASSSEEDRQSRTRNRCNGEGFESVALIPLRFGGETLGLLQFNDRRRDCFNERKIATLERMASNVAIGLAQRRASKELYKSEESLRTVFEAAEDVAFIATDLGGKDTRVLGFSPGAEKIFGYTTEEILDQKVALLHPPEAVEGFPAMKQALTEGQKGHTGEAVLVRKSGEQFPALFTIHPRFDASGQVIGTVAVAMDITERKRVEAALQDQMEMQKLLLRELDHRVRNNLSSLMSLIDMSSVGAGSTDELAAAIRARTQAIASVHAILSEADWRGGDLKSLLVAIVRPATSTVVRAEGERVLIPLAQAQALGLVINEITTNSLKHGAMSVNDGAVDITWTTQYAEDDEVNLTLHWRETGGPRIETQPDPGTGTSVIMGLARSELCGRAELTYPPEGAAHTLHFTLAMDATAQFAGMHQP